MISSGEDEDHSKDMIESDKYPSGKLQAEILYIFIDLN